MDEVNGQINKDGWMNRRQKVYSDYFISMLFFLSFIVNLNTIYIQTY